MPNAIAGFFKQNDQLSSGVSFNYRGEEGFGTILGGACSLLISISFFAFTCL